MCVCVCVCVIIVLSGCVDKCCEQREAGRGKEGGLSSQAFTVQMFTVPVPRTSVVCPGDESLPPHKDPTSASSLWAFMWESIQVADSAASSSSLCQYRTLISGCRHYAYAFFSP